MRVAGSVSLLPIRSAPIGQLTSQTDKMTVPMPFEIPLALHLYRDGREKHCTKLKLTAEECEWYSNWWHNWYTADWAYALPIVYFVCAMIGVLSIRHWAHVIG